MNLIGDVLDRLLFDRDGHRLGRVDGITIEMREGAPPRLDAIEVGAAVAALRLGPRAERFAILVSRWMRVRARPRYRIPWERVSANERGFSVDVDAERSPAFAWERWLRERIVGKVPFSG